LFESFHGKGNIAAQKKIFMAGQGIYARLFTQDSTPSVNGNVVSENSMILHSYLVRLDDRIIKVGPTITEDIISSATLSTDKLISGDNLWSAASEAHKNCKKALAIAEDYLDDKKNLPSGHNLEDYLNHVLQEMYVSLKEKDDEKETPANDEEDADSTQRQNDSSEKTVLPSGWFFKGFWAFYLYGPFPSDNEPASLLEINDLSEFYTNKAILGRKHARSKRSADSETSTAAAATTSSTASPFKRGLSLRDRLTATTIAQTSDEQKLRKNEQQVLVLTKILESLHQSIELAYRRADRTGDVLKANCVVRSMYAKYCQPFGAHAL
jgi:hypothetical protein